VNCSKGQLKWRQYRGCCYLKTPYEIIRRPHPSLRATTNNGREMTTVSRKSYNNHSTRRVKANLLDDGIGATLVAVSATSPSFITSQYDRRSKGIPGVEITRYGESSLRGRRYAHTPTAMLRWYCTWSRPVAWRPQVASRLIDSRYHATSSCPKRGVLGNANALLPQHHRECTPWALYTP